MTRSRCMMMRALLAGLAGTVRGADYAPMDLGNEWVYQGIGIIQPVGGRRYADTSVIRFGEVRK